MLAGNLSHDSQHVQELLGQLSGLGDGQLNAALLSDQSEELFDVIESEDLLDVLFLN
jgi:hypothetical protein